MEHIISNEIHQSAITIKRVPAASGTVVVRLSLSVPYAEVVTFLSQEQVNDLQAALAAAVQE